MGVLIGLGGLLSILSLVCSILILIHAFQQSVGKGFLCLCVPCYIVYYMFSEFEHPKKNLIIAGYWLGVAGSVVANVGMRMGGMVGGAGFGP
jgi:hypothetical protein